MFTTDIPLEYTIVSAGLWPYLSKFLFSVILQRQLASPLGSYVRLGFNKGLSIQLNGTPQVIATLSVESVFLSVLPSLSLSGSLSHGSTQVSQQACAFTLLLISLALALPCPCRGALTFAVSPASSRFSLDRGWSGQWHCLASAATHPT